MALVSNLTWFFSDTEERPWGLKLLFQAARSYSRERAEQTELLFYSIPAVFVVTSTVPAIALKKVT